MSSELVKADELKAELVPVVQRATDMVIVTPADYAMAAQGTKDIKAAIKKVDAFFDPMVRANLVATRATNGKKAEVRGPLLQAEGIYKDKQTAWTREQERVRLAEEARLNAIEQERARKEREKAEAAARMQRDKEIRSQREAYEATHKAAAAKNAAERERLQREAAAQQKIAAAAAAKAEAKEEAAANVQTNTVTVASVAPKIKGQSFRETWKARIVDPKAAATALLQFPDWSAYIEINQGQLDKFAARTSGAVKMAGVEMYKDTVMASTSR